MIRLHRAVLRIYGATFDQWQQIALHALARHVGPRGLLAPCDLVELVDEDDAVLFGILDGKRLELLFVDHFRGFLVDQQLERVLDLQLARLDASRTEILKHALELLRHLLHAGRCHDLHTGGDGANFDFDLAIVELAFPQHFPEALARVGVARCRVARESGLRPRQQRIQNTVFGGISSARTHLGHCLFTGHLDGDLHQIADDRVNLAADIADLRELGGLHLDERRPRQAGQPARDLGLAHAGRPDHENVLRRDLGSEALGNLLAPPAIS